MDWPGGGIQLLWPPLLMLLVANGAPILLRSALGARWTAPLDGGWHLRDGRPLFGHTKCWSGIVAALTATGMTAMLLGLGGLFGLQFALLSMLGDLISSFSKRRMAIPPHERAIGLDQIPEALLPLWLLSESLGLQALDVALGVALFMLLDITLSPLLWRWRIRSHPY